MIVNLTKAQADAINEFIGWLIESPPKTDLEAYMRLGEASAYLSIVMAAREEGE